MNESFDTPAELEIAIVAKAKHADLYRAAKKMGGQSALARHLGIEPTLLSEWCNLKRMPRFERYQDNKKGNWHTPRFADPVKRADLERKLFDLTGKILDDIFPAEVRNNPDILNQPKTREFYTTIDLKRLGDCTPERLLLPDPHDVVAESERTELVKSSLDGAMQRLSYREREIVKMRFGLGGGEPKTLDEVGKAFKISRERVRSLEARAIRRMQQPSVGLNPDNLLPD